MTLFISQPFSGLSEAEIFEHRNILIEKVCKYLDIPREDVNIIDQYHQIAPEGAGRFWYLSQDILLMDTADLIVFSPIWKTASGCRVEHELAVAYDLNFIEFGTISNKGEISYIIAYQHWKIN